MYLEFAIAIITITIIVFLVYTVGRKNEKHVKFDPKIIKEYAKIHKMKTERILE